MSAARLGLPLLLAEDLSQRVSAWWVEIQPTLRDVWGEVTAHKLWYITWVGLFLCTYLMLRMLITRWGDTNVTRKALVLSLLLHFVFGLFTTSLHIATHAGTVGDHSDTTPLRNVIVENRNGAANVRTPTPSGTRRSGDRAAWDQIPTTPAPVATRQERSSPAAGGPLASGGDTAGLPRGERPVETSAARLPDLTASGPAPTTSLPVASVRAVTKVTPLLAGGTPALPAGETPTSRPEATVGEPGPARQARQPAGLASGMDLVPTRRGQPTEIVSALPHPVRDVVSTHASSEPHADLRRGGDIGPRTTKPGLVPPGLPASSAGLPGGDETSKGIGKGTPGGNPFARQSRRPTVGNSAGTGNGGEGGTKGVPRGTGVGGGGEGTVDQSGIPSLPQRLGGGGNDAGDFLAARQGGSGTGGDGGGGGGPGGLGTGMGGGGLFPGDPIPGLRRGPGGGGGTGLPGAGGVPSAYRLRGPSQRKKLAVENGATADSERSVELSLQWLANHQNPAGFWDADGFHVHCPAGDRCAGPSGLAQDPTEGTRTPPEHQQAGLEADAGVTSLAILAFLGAGYKHEEGQYADQLDRALRWLIRQQAEDGFLGGRANRYARMYCHGMATIALGEAYGMTHDESLREPLTKAVQFIIDAQNTSDGGWRYVPGQVSDMSIFGWQLMALKSAQTAGLAIPQDSTDRCVKFLIDQGDLLKAKKLSTHGGLASYRRYKDAQQVEQVEPPKPSMTAEALFCKQILGIKRTNPAVAEAVGFLEQNPPRRATEDLYYWYYGTLAMYHYGGPSWRQWNASIRDLIVAEQRKDGHAAGSWDPRAPWGDFGGRVFSTALSTLTLEVYYRFLPMYRYDEKPRAGAE